MWKIYILQLLHPALYVEKKTNFQKNKGTQNPKNNDM